MKKTKKVLALALATSMAASSFVGFNVLSVNAATEIYAENFDDSASGFSSAGNLSESLYGTATGRSGAIGVGSGRGDTSTTSESLAIEGGVVNVNMDFKIDACTEGKSSNIALLGAASGSTWLNSNKQILTINASATGNGYFGDIAINGESIKDAVLVTDSPKEWIGSLDRDSTGWVHLDATINLDTQKLDVKLTRDTASGVVLYQKSDLDFNGYTLGVNETAKFDRIFASAGKSYGGVFLDNITVEKLEMPTLEVSDMPATVTSGANKVATVVASKGATVTVSSEDDAVLEATYLNGSITLTSKLTDANAQAVKVTVKATNTDTRETVEETFSVQAGGPDAIFVKTVELTGNNTILGTTAAQDVVYQVVATDYDNVNQTQSLDPKITVEGLTAEEYVIDETTKGKLTLKIAANTPAKTVTVRTDVNGVLNGKTITVYGVAKTAEFDQLDTEIIKSTTKTFTVTLKDSEGIVLTTENAGSNATVTWKNAANGVVTAGKIGNVKITATVPGGASAEKTLKFVDKLVVTPPNDRMAPVVELTNGETIVFNDRDSVEAANVTKRMANADLTEKKINASFDFYMDANSTTNTILQAAKGNGAATIILTAADGVITAKEEWGGGRFRDFAIEKDATFTSNKWYTMTIVGDLVKFNDGVNYSTDNIKLSVTDSDGKVIIKDAAVDSRNLGAGYNRTTSDTGWAAGASITSTGIAYIDNGYAYQEGFKLQFKDVTSEEDDTIVTADYLVNAESTIADADLPVSAGDFDNDENKFVGWYTEDGSKFIATRPILSDAVYTAKRVYVPVDIFNFVDTVENFDEFDYTDVESKDIANKIAEIDALYELIDEEDLEKLANLKNQDDAAEYTARLKEAEEVTLPALKQRKDSCVVIVGINKFNLTTLSPINKGRNNYKYLTNDKNDVGYYLTNIGGSSTYFSEIAALQEIYAKLNEMNQAYVGTVNYVVLKTAYETTSAFAAELVSPVIDAIDKLPELSEIDLGSQKTIEAARALVTELPAGFSTLVTNLDKLVAAENALVEAAKDLVSSEDPEVDSELVAAYKEAKEAVEAHRDDDAATLATFKDGAKVKYDTFNDLYIQIDALLNGSQDGNYGIDATEQAALDALYAIYNNALNFVEIVNTMSYYTDDAKANYGVNAENYVTVSTDINVAGQQYLLIDETMQADAEVSKAADIVKDLKFGIDGITAEVLTDIETKIDALSGLKAYDLKTYADNKKLLNAANEAYNAVPSIQNQVKADKVAVLKSAVADYEAFITSQYTKVKSANADVKTKTEELALDYTTGYEKDEDGKWSVKDPAIDIEAVVTAIKKLNDDAAAIIKAIDNAELIAEWDADGDKPVENPIDTAKALETNVKDLVAKKNIIVAIRTSATSYKTVTSDIVTKYAADDVLENAYKNAVAEDAENGLASTDKGSLVGAILAEFTAVDAVYSSAADAKVKGYTNNVSDYQTSYPSDNFEAFEPAYIIDETVEVVKYKELKARLEALIALDGAAQIKVDAWVAAVEELYTTIDDKCALDFVGTWDSYYSEEEGSLGLKAQYDAMLEMEQLCVPMAVSSKTAYIETRLAQWKQADDVIEVISLIGDVSVENIEDNVTAVIAAKAALASADNIPAVAGLIPEDVRAEYAEKAKAIYDVADVMVWNYMVNAIDEATWETLADLKAEAVLDNSVIFGENMGALLNVLGDNNFEAYTVGGYIDYVVSLYGNNEDVVKAYSTSEVIAKYEAFAAKAATFNSAFKASEAIDAMVMPTLVNGKYEFDDANAKAIENAMDLVEDLSNDSLVLLKNYSKYKIIKAAYLGSDYFAAKVSEFVDAVAAAELDKMTYDSYTAIYSTYPEAIEAINDYLKSLDDSVLAEAIKATEEYKVAKAATVAANAYEKFDELTSKVADFNISAKDAEAKLNVIIRDFEALKATNDKLAAGVAIESAKITSLGDEIKVLIKKLELSEGFDKLDESIETLYAQYATNGIQDDMYDALNSATNVYNAATDEQKNTVENAAKLKVLQDEWMNYIEETIEAAIDAKDPEAAMNAYGKILSGESISEELQKKYNDFIGSQEVLDAVAFDKAFEEAYAKLPEIKKGMTDAEIATVETFITAQEAAYNELTAKVKEFVTSKDKLDKVKTDLEAAKPEVDVYDVNRDGVVNAGDSRAVLDGIFERNDQGYNCDVDGNGDVNVIDLVAVIDEIFNRA